MILGQLVEWLLSSGVNVNDACIEEGRYWTALHRACLRNDKALIRLLIACKSSRRIGTV